MCIAATDYLQDIAVEVVMSAFTPDIIEMIIIWNIISENFILGEMVNKLLKVFFIHNCIFQSSENIAIKRQISEVFQAIFWGLLTAINFQVLCFAQVKLFHDSTLSKALNPVKCIVGRCSSWLMCDNNSKQLGCNFISNIEPTKKSYKVHDSIIVEFAVID